MSQNRKKKAGHGAVCRYGVIWSILLPPGSQEPTTHFNSFGCPTKRQPVVLSHTQKGVTATYLALPTPHICPLTLRWKNIPSSEASPATCALSPVTAVGVVSTQAMTQA